MSQSMSRKMTLILNGRFETVLRRFQKSTLTFYTTEFTDQFKRLNRTKVIGGYDLIESPFLNVKMITLDRKILPLYKRLNDKNKNVCRN